MTSAWTQERVLALAPDASSASAGQGLSSRKKWESVGRSERAVWGLCQGSGKVPYQTRIDLSEPAFKCSCPSRKFPCKHGLGLMLLLVKEEKAFSTLAEPEWVSEWLQGRGERAEKRVEKAKEAAAKPVDVEAQAKRAAQREGRIQEGVAECRVWLEDLVRRGLAAAQSERESEWERAAARLVDSQAPGLARLVRQLPMSMASGEGWPVRTLSRIGRLHLLLTAFEGRERLPAELAADLAVAIGRSQAKEEALAGQSVSDRWCVAGQVIEEEDRIRARRTWCFGRASGRRALVLDFAAGPQPFDASLVAGTEFDGELGFYPAGLPLRALVKSRAGATAVFTGGELGGSAEAELGAFARALAKAPWLERWPLVVRGVVDPADGGWVWDPDGSGLPLRPAFAGLWRLIALARGGVVTVMGEWDGEWFTPLAAWKPEGGFVDLAPRWDA
jgi:hypothetical protein